MGSFHELLVHSIQLLRKAMIIINYRPTAIFDFICDDAERQSPLKSFLGPDHSSVKANRKEHLETLTYFLLSNLLSSYYESVIVLPCTTTFSSVLIITRKPNSALL